MQTITFATNKVEKNGLGYYPSVQHLADLAKLLKFDVNVQKFKPKSSFLSNRISDGTDLESTADQKTHSSIELVNKIKNDNNSILCMDVPNPTQRTLFLIIAHHLIKQSDRIFISGTEEIEIERLRMKPDPLFKKAPKYEDKKELYDYLQEKISRRIFMRLMGKTLLDCPFIPEHAHEKANRLISHPEEINELIHDRVFIYNSFCIYDIIKRYEGFASDLVNLMFNDRTDERKFFANICKFMFHPCGIEFLRSKLSEAVDFGKVRIQTEITSAEELFNNALLYQYDIPPNHPHRKKLPYVFSNILLTSRLKYDHLTVQKINFLKEKKPDEQKFWNQRFSFLNGLYDERFGLSNFKSEEQIPNTLKQELIREYYGWYTIVKSPKSDSNFSFANPSESTKKLNSLYQKLVEGEAFKKIRVIHDKHCDTKKNKETNILMMLQRLNMSVGDLNQLLSEVADQISPHSKVFKNIRERFLENLLNKGSMDFQKNIDRFFDNNIHSLPNYLYLLYCREEVPDEHRVIYRGGKIQLGLNYSENLSEPVKIKNESENHYTNWINVTPRFKFKVGEINRKLLFASYDAFIRSNVEKNLTDYTFKRVDLLFKNHGDNLFFHLYSQFLFEGELIIGYHDFYDILLQIKFTSQKQLTKYGYNPNQSDLFNWAKDEYYKIDVDPFEGKSDEELLTTLRSTIFKNRDLYFQYFNDLKQASKKALSTDLEWISDEICKFNHDGYYNLFSNRFFSRIRNNPFSNNLWNYITEFFFDRMRDFQNFGNVKVYFGSDFAFLSIFETERTLEINYENLNVQLVYVPHLKPASIRGLSHEFVKYLHRLKNHPSFDSGIVQLERIYKVVVNHQRKWVKIQQACAFLLNHLIVENAMEFYRNQRNIALKDLVSNFPDNEKQFICGHAKALERVEFKLLYQNYNYQDRSSQTTLPLYNDQLMNLMDLEKQSKYYANLFHLVNHFMSLLPHVRYAPRVIKLFRSSLKELAEKLNTDLIKINMPELLQIERLCLRLRNIFFTISKDEANFPIKARYLYLTLSRLKARRSSHEVDELVNFFKKIPKDYDPELTDVKRKEIFIARLRSSILFRETLKHKKIFFIFPNYDQYELLEKTVSLIKRFKGFSSQIYVDHTSTRHMHDRLYDFIHPSYVIPLKDHETQSTFKSE